MKKKITITIWAILICLPAFSQIDKDSLITNFESNTLTETDTIVIIDSALIKRQEYIRDSLLARELFVQDSLHRRKLILDSVRFLQQELPRLLEAAIKASNEEIIISIDKVDIIGDSILSDFTYRVLSPKISKPYAPWRSTIGVSKPAFKLKIDSLNKVVTYIRIAKQSYKYSYRNGKNIVKLTRKSSIIKKTNGTFYKLPIDSIFFDTQGRVKKIKQYIHYFEATKSYQRGASLGIDITNIKEFEYFPDGVLSKYKITTYCNRWSGMKANQKCHEVTYSISRKGRIFTIVEKNKPVNKFSDGTFVYEFDNNFDLKSMEFISAAKELSKKCFVELNKDGYVSRYLYKNNGIINKTLLINYNNKPGAKYKYETITCQFEKDRICYYQKNNRTGKSRKRNRMTLKWSEWK